MEKIELFFKGPFMDFLNGPVIPGIIVIVGIVTFFVLFHEENKRINELIEKHRRERVDKSQKK